MTQTRFLACLQLSKYPKKIEKALQCDRRSAMRPYFYYPSISQLLINNSALFIKKGLFMYIAKHQVANWLIREGDIIWPRTLQSVYFIKVIRPLLIQSRSYPQICMLKNSSSHYWALYITALALLYNKPRQKYQGLKWYNVLPMSLQVFPYPFPCEIYTKHGEKKTHTEKGKVNWVLYNNNLAIKS